MKPMLLRKHGTVLGINLLIIYNREARHRLAYEVWHMVEFAFRLMGKKEMLNN